MSGRVCGVQAIEQPLVEGDHPGKLEGAAAGAQAFLLENFAQQPAAPDLGLGARFQLGAEAGEDFQFEELQVVELHPSRLFLDARVLRLAADAGDRQRHVHRRQDAGGEQPPVEVDLAVGDGDEIGGDVGGDLAFLGFDDGQRGQAAAAMAAERRVERSSRRACR